jgi:TRAP transporter TAXI family solute receptor
MDKMVSKIFCMSLSAVILMTGLFYDVASAADDWPNVLHITSPANGPKYFAPLALSGVLQDNTSMKVRVIPDEVPFQRLKAFRDGDFDIYVNGAGAPIRFMQGEQEHAIKGNGPLPIRIMWPAVIESFAPMMRGDSKIKTTEDLKNGFTIGAPPGATPQANCYCIAAWAGLKDDEWKLAEYGSMDSAINAVPDGQTDMVWWITDAGQTYEAETNPKGLSWLDLDPIADPEGAARATDLCPEWAFGDAPASSVKSAKGKKVVLVPTYFYVKPDMDEDLVYKLVKFIDENNAAVVKNHPSASSQSLESFKSVISGNFMPFHSGTIKYLKEKGLWTEADQKQQDFNVKLLNKYIETFDMAVKDAESQNIKPLPNNKEWLVIWEKYKAALPPIKSRTEFPEL